VSGRGVLLRQRGMLFRLLAAGLGIRGEPARLGGVRLGLLPMTGDVLSQALTALPAAAPGATRDDCESSDENQRRHDDDDDCDGRHVLDLPGLGGLHAPFDAWA